MGEFEERQISLAPDGVVWLTTILPTETADAGRKITPLEQIEQIFHDYITGKVMAYDTQRKRLEPDANFVWEFKTPDVRVFGWLPRKRHFIVVTGQMKRNLKPRKLYKSYIQQVVAFRDGLKLDPPKQLEGIRQNEGSSGNRVGDFGGS